jgi:hypothetical protein
MIISIPFNSSWLARLCIQIRIGIGRVVFLHHSKVHPHLISLFWSKRGELSSLLGSVLGRPFCEFPGLTIMFCSGKMGLVGLLNHKFPTIAKICYLQKQTEQTTNTIIFNQREKISTNMKHSFLLSLLHVHVSWSISAHNTTEKLTLNTVPMTMTAPMAPHTLWFAVNLWKYVDMTKRVELDGRLLQFLYSRSSDVLSLVNNR